MLSSSSASMFDLYFYGTKTFSGDFELYIADVILHLKTCGLRVRLRALSEWDEGLAQNEYI